MRTDFQTQLPIDITRVQATSSATAVERDNVRTTTPAGTSSQQSQTSVKQKAKDVEKEVHSLNEELKSKNVELKISRDDETGIVVMKLVDSSTGDALNQIPSEVSLRLAEVFNKLGIGLINSKA